VFLVNESIERAIEDAVRAVTEERRRRAPPRA